MKAVYERSTREILVIIDKSEVQLVRFWYFSKASPFINFIPHSIHHVKIGDWVNRFFSQGEVLSRDRGGNLLGVIPILCQHPNRIPTTSSNTPHPFIQKQLTKEQQHPVDSFHTYNRQPQTTARKIAPRA